MSLHKLLFLPRDARATHLMFEDLSAQACLEEAQACRIDCTIFKIAVYQWLKLQRAKAGHARERHSGHPTVMPSAQKPPSSRPVP